MKPGIYRDVPFAEYAAWPAVNSHAIIAGHRRSLAHMRAAMEYRDEPTAAMEFGRALHLAALEPAKFAAETVVSPEFAGKGSVAARAEWQAANAGKVHLDRQDAEAIDAMLGALHRHRLARWLLKQSGGAEVSIVWEDATGVPCKARIDMLIPSRALCDLKTAADASPREFANAVARYGYHYQAAHYRAGWRALTGQSIPWVWIVAEKTAPWGVACYVLREEDATAAEALNAELLRRYADASKSGEFPGYGESEFEELVLPKWA